MKVEIKKIIHLDNPKCQLYAPASPGMICLDAGTSGKVTVSLAELKDAIIEFEIDHDADRCDFDCDSCRE